MRKKIAIGSACLALVLFIYVMSNPGLLMLANFAKSNWETASWAPNLLYNAGTIAFYTLRWEAGKTYYSEFLEKCEANHKLSPGASYRLAKCYQELDMKVEAIDEYLWFSDNFPNHPKYAFAIAEAKRIAHIPGYKSF